MPFLARTAGKRLFWSLRSAAVLVTCVLGVAASVHAQSCITDLSIHDVGTALRGSDGKYHVTYDLSQASPNVQQAAQAAFNEWNGFSSTPGVVFEPVQAGGYANIEFKADSTKTDCAAYGPGTSRIYYGPGFEQRAAFSISAATTALAHEIGHYLGLDEAGTNPPQPTIMNQAPPGSNCVTATVPTDNVQPGDASKATECVQQAHDVRSGGGGGARDESYPWTDRPDGFCTAEYLVTDHYLCGSSGCTYLYTTTHLLWTDCWFLMEGRLEMNPWPARVPVERCSLDIQQSPLRGRSGQ